MTETKYVRNGIIPTKLEKTQPTFPLLIYHNSGKSSKCSKMVKLNENYPHFFYLWAELISFQAYGINDIIYGAFHCF